MKKIAFTIVLFIFISYPLYANEKVVSVEKAYREVKITGFTRPRSVMPLASEFSGIVKKVFVDIGNTIPLDGKFACIDDTFIDLDIKKSVKNIAMHSIDIKYHKKQVLRHRQLAKQKSVAASLLDENERLLAKSENALQAEKIRKQILEEEKRRFCITAPVGWSVIDRMIEPGQWIEKGKPVAEIADFSKLLIPIAISVQEMIALRAKEKNLTVRLSDYNQQVSAAIERVSPAFDESSRKILVDLEIEKNIPEHRGGLRVEILLKLPEKENVFFISKKAVDERFEEAWLHPVKGGSNIKVTLLGVEGDKAKILSADIKFGDQFKLIHP